jgi:hypothetical protein
VVVAVVVAVVVVDRAVRSAGKRLASSENWGRSDAAPVIFKFRFTRSGFTPKSALPIIAPLGGGPNLNWTRA